MLQFLELALQAEQEAMSLQLLERLLNLIMQLTHPVLVQRALDILRVAEAVHCTALIHVRKLVE
tara:strand:+ start:1408 stop:1599 length:192 start_codon:yes stop_codon:yes gene_type:complete